MSAFDPERTSSAKVFLRCTAQGFGESKRHCTGVRSPGDVASGLPSLAMSDLILGAISFAEVGRLLHACTAAIKARIS
jgi:hypothetical protein